MRNQTKHKMPIKLDQVKHSNIFPHAHNILLYLCYYFMFFPHVHKLFVIKLGLSLLFPFWRTAFSHHLDLQSFIHLKVFCIKGTEKAYINHSYLILLYACHDIILEFSMRNEALRLLKFSLGHYDNYLRPTVQRKSDEELNITDERLLHFFQLD